MLSDEEGKAVQEVAKATGTSVDAVREFGGFIAKYIGGSLEQAIGIWEDKLKYRRWENQIALAEKAKKLLAGRGIDGPTRTLNLSLAIPLLEEASLEDVESMQDRWAALLANAADASVPQVRRAYVSILADMTPLDAAVLEKLFDADQAFVPTEQTEVAELWTHRLPDSVAPLPGARNQDQEPVELHSYVAVSLANLARLGLIESAMAWGGKALMSAVRMTELGREFVFACRPNT